MSLINEALKKAQRQRTEGPAADAPPIPGGVLVTKRAAPRSANSVVLIASGAIALVVLSVVATVYLLNRPKPQPAVAKATAPTASASKAPASDASAAPLVPPKIALPPANPPAADAETKSTTPDPASPASATSAKAPKKETPKSDRAAETKSPSSATPANASAARDSAPASDPLPAVATAPATQAPTAPQKIALATSAPPVASTSAPSAPPPVTPAAAPKPDERITAYVEGLKVAGIRSSGTESRVLMNDRVYRVNDIVDRNLGVRLVKVAVDSLTFADANGATYVKYF